MAERNIREIGHVSIDYTFYPGVNFYSDGSIEDELLDVFKQEKVEDVLHSRTEWPILYHLSDIRKNVIEWYPIENDSETLEIGSGCGAITGILSEKSKSVTCVELSEKRSLINAERNKERKNINILLGNFQDMEHTLGKFDIITLIGVLEYAKLYIKSDNPYTEMLSIVKKHLKENGKLIIAIENKMGIKYINGAPEDHIGQPFAGINDYISNDEVRTFSSKEIEKMLNEVGYTDRKFYYPVPDYKLPFAIYSSEYMPRPGNLRTYRTNYDKIRLYNFYEDIMNDQISTDEMFNYMANSFIIIAGNAVYRDVIFSKYSRERKSKYRVSTIIKRDNNELKVIKKPLSAKANEHILALKSNEEKWKTLNDNLKKLEGYIDDNCYVVSYIKGNTLEEKLYYHRNSTELFIEKVRDYLSKYYSVEGELIPFEKTDAFMNVFGDLEINNMMSLKTTNVDLLFSNIILDKNGDAYTYDFEWVFDFPVPYNYVKWRAAKEAYYRYYVYFKDKMNAMYYYKKLCFSEDEVNVFKKMEKNFNEYVCGKNRYEIYTDNYVKGSVMPTMTMIV